MTSRLLLVWLLAVAMVGMAWANPAPGQAETLVRELGNPSYKARERAAADLLRLGRSAYSALQVGAADSNPEIRFRCKQLLPRIYDLEMQARVAAFVANPDTEPHLPGWTRFRRLYGSDAGARNLFVEMLRADGRTMDLVESEPKAGAEKLMIRCAHLQPRYARPAAGAAITITRADVAQLLFLGSHPDLALSTQAIVQINQFLYRPELRAWITGGDGADLVKRIVLAWIDRYIDDVNMGYLISNMAQNVPISDWLKPASKIALNTKAVPHVRANALTVIGRLGDKSHVASLEALILEPTVVQQFAFNRVKGTVQIGDIALAMCLHLSGQKPGEYGFEAVKQNPTWVHAYYYLGFETDEKREEARKKWQDWKAAAKNKTP